MRACLVVGCNSNSKRDKISFHRFPSMFNKVGRVDALAQERREKWIKSLRRSDITEKKLKYGHICSKHFLGGKPCKLSEIDDIDWIPRQNMGYESTIATAKEKLNQLQKLKYRNKEKLTGTEIFSKVKNQIKHEITENSIEYLIDEDNQIYKLRDPLQQPIFDLEFLKNDSEQCQFYTGLDFENFNVVFKYISPFLSSKQSNVLNKVEVLVLTLMKLRLNLLFQDLGYRFNISEQSARTVFFSVVNILYTRLKFLIHWPTRECLQMNVPACFHKHFGTKIIVIINVIEIFTEAPSNKNAPTQHFSKYKHHDTIKFLIGLSPQGCIIFISKAFPGQSSDKFIVDNSSLLCRIIPGDVILTNREFLINNQARQYLAEVEVPTHLSGAKKIIPKDVEETPSLTNVRISVERVISQLKEKFTILGDVLPDTKVKDEKHETPIINKILTVCCALVNICPSVI